MKTGNEGADVTELGEESRRRVEAQIEQLIFSDALEQGTSVEKSDDEGVKERQRNGETSGEQEHEAEGRHAVTYSVV